LPSGSIVASTPGETISARSVSGSITVAADGVQIVDTQVVPTIGGNGSAGIVIQSGVSGTRIQNTTVAGPGGGAQSLEAAVRNSGSGTVATLDNFYNCSDCWEGSGEISNTYMRIDSIFPGAHAEDIYVCSGQISVYHSTLLNAEEQTATVFGDTICGGGNSFTVTDSLLAGGGYVLYPQANSSGATGSMRVVGNRIGRCTGAPAFERISGGTSCASGFDENGFRPYGGYFGLAAAYYVGGSANIWEGNVWADSSASVCPDGRPGCPALSPASEPPPLLPWGTTTTTPAPVPAAAAPSTGTSPKHSAGAKHAKKPRAITKVAATVRVGRPLKLRGGAKGAKAPISCRWVVRRAADSKVLARRRGCRTTVSLRRAGTAYVTLKVRDASGARDRKRRKVEVRPR
jgi:hypothetical protein